MLKYLHINFQIWFPKYNFKNPKYIKNIEVCSLRTPGLSRSLLRHAQTVIYAVKFQVAFDTEMYSNMCIKPILFRNALVQKYAMQFIEIAAPKILHSLCTYG